LFFAVSSQGQTAVENPQPPPVDKTVQVFLTASDKQGSPATTSQSEISVSVDRQPAQIGGLRSAKNDPLLFAVLVDTSGSRARAAEEIKQTTLELFQGLATAGNQGYLVLFNHSIAISTRPLQILEVKGLLDSVRFGPGTALYDAIEQTCVQKLGRLGNPDNPRRAILLITDGDDNQSHVTHTDLEAAVEKEGVAVFSMATWSSLEGTRGEKFLKEVSHDTGGQAIIVKNLADGVAPLLSAIENQASLTVVPAQSLGQGVHSLDIKSSEKDVRISGPAHIFVQ
jgi:hypothetical protein